MSAGKLAGVRACVFDAYGTLFDYGSAAAKCRGALGDKFAALTTLWRDKQLQYTWLRSLGGRHADFWQVTGDALDFSLDALGMADPTLRARLMEAYLTLEAFPDVPATLATLKAAGLKTAILSNGTPAMLGAAIDNAGLADRFDHVLSVEAVGVFKTDARVYTLAVDRLGVAAGEICFVSSNGWDAHAASAYGMRVLWCNRTGQRPERLPGAPDHETRSLADFPALLGISEGAARA